MLPCVNLLDEVTVEVGSICKVPGEIAADAVLAMVPEDCDRSELGEEAEDSGAYPDCEM